MRVIEKNIDPEYFQEILDGKKTYELRLNNFEISEGDTLRLIEWYRDTGELTGRMIEKKVGFVRKWKFQDLEKFYKKEDIENYGIQVISLL